MTAATFTAPLDVLRTRLQSDYYQAHLSSLRASRGIPNPSTMTLSRSSLLHIRETFHILYAIPRVEGRRALFKGLAPTLIGVVPARAINFYVYGNGKRILSNNFNNGKETAWIHLSSAVVAGIVNSTVTNPIWLVKTRLQLDKSKAQRGGERQYKNALDCVLKTVRAEGIRGLYRGLSASYLGVSESTLQWVLYEQLKKTIHRREAQSLITDGEPTTWDRTLSWISMLSAAGGAKFIASAVTYPHEVSSTCHFFAFATFR